MKGITMDVSMIRKQLQADYDTRLAAATAALNKEFAAKLALVNKYEEEGKRLAKELTASALKAVAPKKAKKAKTRKTRKTKAAPKAAASAAPKAAASPKAAATPKKVTKTKGKKKATKTKSAPKKAPAKKKPAKKAKAAKAKDTTAIAEGRRAVARGDRPPLVEAVATVMGSKVMNSGMILEKLTAKGWQPNSNDSKSYLSYVLSSNKEAFEKVPEKGRGYYRVKPGFAPKSKRVQTASPAAVAGSKDTDATLAEMGLSEGKSAPTNPFQQA